MGAIISIHESQRNVISFSFKFFSLLVLAMLVIGKTWGQLYWNTNGTSASWTSANWSTSSSGLFNSSWIDNSDIIFTENSTITYVSLTPIGNITVSDGKSITIIQDGTLSTNKTIRTFNIGSGSTLIWSGQSVSTTSGTGFIKNGTGIWNIGAQANEYNGGFTLNNGTVIVTGGKSFGGANSLLSINGGTINITGGTTHSNNIIIGGDFTFTGTATTTFSGYVNIGAATRSITNSITSGSRIFSGIISGGSGSGLTFNGSSPYPISLAGKNTYDGLTTINGGILILNANGGGTLKSGNAVTVGGGTLEVAQSQTLGNFTMTSGTLKVDAGQTLTINGIYNVSGGTINNQGTIIINGNSAQTFPGYSTTINNGTAGQMTNLIIDNNFGVSIDKSISLSNLTINSNAKLTNNISQTLTITNLNINSDATGTGTFIDNGISSITTANVQQYLTSGRNWYVSTPVSTSTVDAISSATSVVYWDEPTGNWVTAASGTTMNPLKGYISSSTKTDGVIKYTGSLTNGNQSIDLTRTSGKMKEGFNLIGNPYPSYLDANSAINNTPNMDKSLWFRTKNSDNTTYVFESVNTSSGIGTNNSGNGSVTGIIPPMQAFWVRVATGQNGAHLTFTNSLRQHSTGSNPLKVKSINGTNQIIRLQVSNGTNCDETIIHFNPNASFEYDMYDSPKMSNLSASVPEIYTLAGNEQVAINGLNNITENTEIPLGFTTGEANSFTIKATEITNFDPETQIILKDNELNTETNLTNYTVYNFKSDVVNSINRFSLIFKTNTMTTGTSLQSNVPLSVHHNGMGVIAVNCATDKNGVISAYNSLGQKLETKAITSRITVLDNTFSAGVYFINIVINGANATKKIIVN